MITTEMTRATQAVMWMILTGFLAVSINTLARYLSDDYHVFQIVFFYNILGLLFFLPLVIQSRVNVVSNISGKAVKMYIYRAILEFTSFSLMFAALPLMTLPVHTALSFTSPLFGAVVAILILREKASTRRVVALLAGFIGVMVIARPVGEEFNIATLMVLLAAFGFAICGLFIKKLTSIESNTRIAFYMMLMTSLISLPFAVSVWNPVVMEDVLWLLLLGIMVALVQYSVSQAFSKADMCDILPIFFLNLVWSSIYAYFIFGEVIDGWTATGALIIILSTTYGAHYARRRELEEIVATENASGGN